MISYQIFGCGSVGNIITKIWSRLPQISVNCQLLQSILTCGLVRLSARLEIVGCGYIKNSRLQFRFAVMRLTDHSLRKIHISFRYINQKNMCILYFQKARNRPEARYKKARPARVQIHKSPSPPEARKTQARNITNIMLYIKKNFFS